MTITYIQGHHILQVIESRLLFQWEEAKRHEEEEKSPNYTKCLSLCYVDSVWLDDPQRHITVLDLLSSPGLES